MPHDGRADNAAYRHDRRADNAAYRHDRRADSLSRMKNPAKLPSLVSRARFLTNNCLKLDIFTENNIQNDIL